MINAARKPTASAVGVCQGENHNDRCLNFVPKIVQIES